MDGAVAGSSKKSTIYVGGFAPEVNEQQLLDAFVTFGLSLSSQVVLFMLCETTPLISLGDILDISIPTEPHERMSKS